MFEFVKVTLELKREGDIITCDLFNVATYPQLILKKHTLQEIKVAITVRRAHLPRSIKLRLRQVQSSSFFHEILMKFHGEKAKPLT